jgi:DNA-binding FrmR family transcriptional regulator
MPKFYQRKRGGTNMLHRPDHQVDNLVKRINRIEGQIGGIKKMIVDEKPFDEVIIQLNSAKAAIQKISQILLEAHADHTFMDAVESGKTEQELESLRRAIHQYSKML